MTNQKTPEHGGATKEQIEAAAYAVAESFGFERETVDAERALDGWKFHAEAALSASASAHPAGEHHDAEERESEPEDHAATVTPIMQCSDGLCPMGCSHLMWACAKCSCEGGWGAEREKLEALSATHVCPEPHAAAAPDDREKLIAEARDWARYDATGASKIVLALCDALAAPVEIDEAKLAEVIWAEQESRVMNGYVIHTRETARTTAAAVIAHLRGEGR